MGTIQPRTIPTSVTGVPRSATTLPPLPQVTAPHSPVELSPRGPLSLDPEAGYYPGSGPLQSTDPYADVIVGDQRKRLDVVRDRRWDAQVLLDRREPAAPAGVLALLSGVGTRGYSNLGSMMGSAARFRVVRSAEGRKLLDAKSQPITLATSGMAWPFHGGPEDRDLAQLPALMQWLGSYLMALRAEDTPRIALGRSFGGTALLEYLVRGGSVNQVIAVSPYTPAWTGFVLDQLSTAGRDFNLPGWEWVMRLDGMLPLEDANPFDTDRFSQLIDRYRGMAIDHYWGAVRQQSQWKFPRELRTRLLLMWGIDPYVNNLWRTDWRALDAKDRDLVQEQAAQIRRAANLPDLAGRALVIFGEEDAQYPQWKESAPMDRPEASARTFWQAMSVAFGFDILGVRAGHDPLNGPRADRRAVQRVYDTIRKTLDKSMPLA